MPQINKGFSLIELSIVLVIIGILVTIALSLSGGQVNVDNIKTTQAKLDRIDRAIASYLKTNNALPCPADATAPVVSIGSSAVLTNIYASQALASYSKPTGALISIVLNGNNTGFSNNDLIDISGVTFFPYLNGRWKIQNVSINGFDLTNSTASGIFIPNNINGTASTAASYSNASCQAHTATLAGYNWPGGSPNYYVGIVPVRSIGLSDDYAFDGWGRRIIYAVSKSCVDPDNWSGDNINRCTDSTGSTSAGADGGNITINDLTNSPSVKGSAKISNAAYVVLSLGKNGNGAYSRNGAKAATLDPAVYTKEANNASADYSSATFNDGAINDSGTADKYFDDIVHWKTAAGVWDSAYYGVLPPCAADQILVSNNGSSYRCMDDSAVMYSYQKTMTPVTDSRNNDPYAALPLPPPPPPAASQINTYNLTTDTNIIGARYFYIEGTCNLNSNDGNNSIKTFSNITYATSGGGNNSFGKACEARSYGKTTDGSTYTDVDSRFVRIPKGTTTITVTFDWAYNDSRPPGKYTIYFMK